MKMLSKSFKLLSLTLLVFTLSACNCWTGAKCCSAKDQKAVALLSAEQKEFLAMPRDKRIARFANAHERKVLRNTGYYPQTYKVAVPVLKENQSVSFVLKETTVVSANAVTKNVPSAPKTQRFTKVKASVTVPPYILVEIKDGKLEIGNLKIHTAYELEIKIISGKGKKVESISSKIVNFTTEGTAPRLVKVAGVPNVRDLGGRKGLNGKYVRQGLIYRTAGLNDNASHKAITLKEAEKKFGKAYFDAQKKFEADMADWTAKNPESKFAAVKKPSEWTVFIVDEKTPDSRITELKTIPAKFCGVAGKKIQMNKKNCFSFPKPAPGKAVFLKEINSPADGMLICSCGADWFWKLFCNGKLAADYEVNGNSKKFNAENYAFILPLKKGKNLIAATVISGSDTWSWCCNFSHAKALNVYKKVQKEAFYAKFGTVRKPGKNRLTKTTTKYLVENLGLRSDIDLRSDGECWQMTGSPAGKEVTWFHYSSSAYGGMSLQWGKMQFTKVFKVFLNAKNYPIAFHCIAGQDRTGAVAFILNGLLGVCEEELYRDWEATCFWNPDPNFNHKLRFNHLVAVFEKLPGKNMTEKVENYVLSCGFTKKDIETFRSFMLE